MMTPLPSQPSNPQTAWIYLIASFLLLYGTLLYFYTQYLWPLGEFVNGVRKHAGYYWQGLRAVFIHDPISAQVWQLYVQFMTRQELWIPFLLRAFGGFVLLPLAVGWFLSFFSFKQPTEIHIRGLRYEPDVKKGVAWARVSFGSW